MERASRYSPEVRERAVRMVLVQEKVDFHRPPCPERTSTCRSAIGAGSNRSGSPYCPDPQQWPHGLASGRRVQPAQPDRNADRPVEERDRPQTQIPQLLQADHGDPGRPESSEHNDRTRTACVRTYRLTLPLGKGRIPSPPRSMQQRSVTRFCWATRPRAFKSSQLAHLLMLYGLAGLTWTSESSYWPELNTT